MKNIQLQELSKKFFPFRDIGPDYEQYDFGFREGIEYTMDVLGYKWDPETNTFVPSEERQWGDQTYTGGF